MGVFSQYGRGIVPETGRTRKDRAEWVRPGLVEFNVIVNPVFMSETSTSRTWRHFSGPVKWMLPINDEQGILIA